MSEYIVACDNSYIVSDENIDRALEYLDACGARNIVPALMDDGRYMLDFCGYAPWEGDQCSGWSDEVAFLVGKWCEPGSYASFRTMFKIDGSFCYACFWKDMDGEAHAEFMEIENPFYGLMQELDDKALGMLRT